MKKALIISAFILLYKVGFACQCDPHEPNFYRNVNQGNYNCIAVLDTSKNSYGGHFVGQTGYFVVIDSLWNFNAQVGDTIVVQGQDGVNCGEGMLRFSPGDTIFLSLEKGYYPDSLDMEYYLEGTCGTHYLEIKNGKSAGLTIPQIKTKIKKLFNSTSINCDCTSYHPYNTDYNFNDFYNNVSDRTYNCMAVFQGYDYSYTYEGLQSQTGHFKLMDTIGPFPAKIGGDIVILGEDGRNCGEMLNRFTAGDTLFLALIDGTYESFEKDTFYLQGGICGKYFLEINNGTNDGLSIEEIIDKIQVAVDVLVIDYDRSVTLFPNPAKNIVGISTTDFQISRIQIIDLKGKLISDIQHIHNRYYKLDISSMTPGMYNANIFTNKGLVQKRLLKK